MNTRIMKTGELAETEKKRLNNLICPAEWFSAIYDLPPEFLKNFRKILSFLFLTMKPTPDNSL